MNVLTYHNYIVKSAYMEIDNKIMEGIMVPEKNVTKHLWNIWTHWWTARRKAVYMFITNTSEKDNKYAKAEISKNV